jgi:predicted DsbA family dithiol-disulfide isomerase
MAESIRVDIVSDVVCPWCYIGWSRLKKAAGELGSELGLEVHWLPFELNPDMPAEGMERQAYLERKFGKERLGEIYGRIEEAALADELPIRFDRIERSPSTLKAHRLLLLAEEANKGTELNERLFEDYFVEGRDIGDEAVLADAAGAVGLPRDKAAEFLASDVGTEEVKALEAEAHRLGIQGVPFFILDRRLAVSGAQTPDVLVDALRKALEMRATEGPPPEV